MIELCILLTITIILSWKFYSLKYGDINKLPGPSSLELFKIMQQSKSETNAFMLNATKKYGGVVKLWIKPFAPMVLISDPDVVMNILKSPHNLRKTAFYRVLAVFLGEDLATLQSVTDWRHDRKVMGPCMSTSNIKKSIDIFQKNLDGLFNNIRKTLNQSVDFGKLISLYTITSSVEISTRKSHNFQETLDYKYVKVLFEAFEYASERLHSIILRNDFLFKFTKSYKKGMIAANTIKELVDLDRSQTNGSGDVLDLMINNDIPDDRRHDQLLSFIIGTHDTTKSALAFMVYLISRHPDVQRKLLQETIDLLGTEKMTSIPMDLASKMNYMKCVINESLRFHPTVPLIQRTLGTDINANGHVIPRDTNVAISLVGMHKDKKYFENPLEFDPDRFLPENRHKIPAGAFLPFSSGPRDCFGKQLAMLIMSSTIAQIIRNFEILPVMEHKLDVVLDFVSSSQNGYPVVFRERGPLEERIQ